MQLGCTHRLAGGPGTSPGHPPGPVARPSKDPVGRDRTFDLAVISRALSLLSYDRRTTSCRDRPRLAATICCRWDLHPHASGAPGSRPGASRLFRHGSRVVVSCSSRDSHPETLRSERSGFAVCPEELSIPPEGIAPSSPASRAGVLSVERQGCDADGGSRTRGLEDGALAFCWLNYVRNPRGRSRAYGALTSFRFTVGSRPLRRLHVVERGRRESHPHHRHGRPAFYCLNYIRMNGHGRNRTCDLLRVRETLFSLSYAPGCVVLPGKDSHLDLVVQSHASCCWTTGHCLAGIRTPITRFKDGGPALGRPGRDRGRRTCTHTTEVGAPPASVTSDPWDSRGWTRTSNIRSNSAAVCC